VARRFPKTTQESREHEKTLQRASHEARISRSAPKTDQSPHKPPHREGQAHSPHRPTTCQRSQGRERLAHTERRTWRGETGQPDKRQTISVTRDRVSRQDEEPDEPGRRQREPRDSEAASAEGGWGVMVVFAASSPPPTSGATIAGVRFRYRSSDFGRSRSGQHWPRKPVPSRPLLRLGDGLVSIRQNDHATGQAYF
jgi:hypothetical protein